MIYGSVCSGIEAASVAWRPLGWKTSFLSENAKFPRAVLSHRFPNTPLHGDFTTIQDGEYEPIDLLVGGTPCQDFSIAGLRAGMDGDRGNLTLQFLALAGRLRPKWLVWENVPGVLSSGGGRDFGTFLGGLGELGYGWAYRTLDAQYFGVPQRRRRVFVVGYLGDWRRAAAVLFERHCLQGNPTPSREAGKVAPTIPSRSLGGDGLGTDFDCDGGLVQAFGGNNTSGAIDCATALAALAAHGGPHGRLNFASETFIVAGMLTGNGDAHSGFKDEHGLITFGWQNSASQGDSANNNITPTLDKSKTPAIAFNLRGRDGGALPECTDLASLRAASGGSSRSYIQQSAVRRLTPLECERLQGFPDGWTQVPYRDKTSADGPRYKALGNSMAVPVMAWIGHRIQMVEDLRREA